MDRLYIEDQGMPNNIMDNRVWEATANIHAKELKDFLQTEEVAARKGNLMRMKTEIMKKRRQLYLQDWNAKLQEKQQDWEARQQVLEMKRKEQELFDRISVQNKRFEELSRNGKNPNSVADVNELLSEASRSRVGNWVAQQATTTRSTEKLKTHSMPDNTSLQHRQQDLNAMQQQARQAAKAHKALSSKTRKTAKKQVGPNPKQGTTEQPHIEPSIPQGGLLTGLEHLHRIGPISEQDLKGLDSPPPPEKHLKTQWQAARDELEDSCKQDNMQHWKTEHTHRQESGKIITTQTHNTTTTNTGPIIVTPAQLQDNAAGYVITGTKQKLKSGKYAKHNINIIQEESWPHISVLRKYNKRVPFEQLDFEAFIAGETITILMMKELPMVLGCLRLLSQLAYWLSSCRNWPLVWGLYEAIVKSIE